MKISEVIEQLDWYLQNVGDLDVKIGYTSEYFSPIYHRFGEWDCEDSAVGVSNNDGAVVIGNNTYLNGALWV